MFRKKYVVTILNSKWEVFKNKESFITIPRSGEYIFSDEKYYEVLNIIHVLGDKKGVFVVINESPNYLSSYKPVD